ncbi:MAG TPA: tetratricopeptide repeat protein [Verrucomicrobiae bacterium]|nr:tetratricopeptide repeat protein [Verrucomicrobiae bacterium]
MKRSLALVFLLLLLATPRIYADSPDDKYVDIYNTIHLADTLAENGKIANAMGKYLEAQTALKTFQTNYPDWNVKIVKFRLNYLTTKISSLSSLPAPVSASTNAPAETPTNAPANPPANASTNAPPAGGNKTALPQASDSEDQIKGLQDQIRRLEGDRAILEAKLKEALSAQPAAVDPQEFAKAEEKIRSLEKENDLLKISLAQAKTNSVPAADPAALEQTRKALADANRQLTRQAEVNASLVLERDALQARLKSNVPADDNTIALRAENEVLKKQLSELKGRGAPAGNAEELSRKLQEAQTQLAALQSDKEILRLEKIALENRINSAPKGGVTVTPAMADAATKEKIKTLEAERNELKKSLEAATRKTLGRKKGAETAARLGEMTSEIAALRARLGVFEERQVPYSPEELALFSKPESKLAVEVHATAKKPAKTPPPGTASLVADARRCFAAGKFDEAEEKYQEVLQKDEKNIATLAGLATIQIELKKYDDAERNIKTALQVDPADAYSLMVLGHLKFEQKKYDEALDALSQAAKAAPQDAEIQNFLGITLSQKGLRGPAETALRKAIQIDPAYGIAHNNLAVVYISEQPPLVELARWHYQKALAAGQPHNPDLEKLLDGGKTASVTR